MKWCLEIFVRLINKNCRLLDIVQEFFSSEHQSFSAVSEKISTGLRTKLHSGTCFLISDWWLLPVLLYYIFKDDNIGFIDLPPSQAGNWIQKQHSWIEFQIKWNFLELVYRMRERPHDNQITVPDGNNPNHKSSNAKLCGLIVQKQNNP